MEQVLWKLFAKHDVQLSSGSPKPVTWNLDRCCNANSATYSRGTDSRKETKTDLVCTGEVLVWTPNFLGHLFIIVNIL